MDNKLVESYLEFIAGKVVDEDKIVTYKSLSRNLNVHVNTAKQLLYIYLTKEKSKNTFSISATYLVAGKVIDGSCNISIINESDLKEAHSKLIQVTSQHVYSVQKGKNLKEVKCLSGVNKEAASQSSKLVIKHSKNVLKQKEKVKRKSHSDEAENKRIIKNALVSPKKTVVTGTKEKTETVTVEEKKTEMVTREPKVEEKKTETTHKKTSPKKHSEKVQTNVKKPTGNIANLFAKVNQKNAEKSVKADSKNEHKSVAEVINEEDTRSGKSNERETSKKRSQSKESLNRKKNDNKRRRIQMISDSEESEDDDDDDDDEEKEEEQMEVDLEEKQSPPAITNLDAEMEETKELVCKNKRKKRKVIDKTVMNEDGYLETKKEIVFETDSEDEREEVVKPKEEKRRKADTEKAVQGPKKQSSLLSFFNKKG